MYIKIKYIVLLNLILFIIQDCVVINELLPKTPTESISPSNIIQFPKEKLVPENQIAMEYFFIKGFEEPHTPSLTTPTANLKNFLLDANGSIDLNRSAIIRYYNLKNKDKKVKRIIILISGIYSGGGTVANLGYSISRRLDDSEVWIWERRANLLEDRRILKKAIKEKNTKLLTNLLKNEKFELKENSFYQPTKEDISFVGYWGLNVLLSDLYNVILEAKTRSDEVVLAGYSLGVLYVTMFLSNNFNIDNNIIAGHSLVDKAILLDGPPMINGYVKTEFDYQNGVTIIPYNIIEGKKKLESGKYYPCSGTVSRDMSFFFLMNVKSILAYLDPTGLSPEPYNTGVKNIPITNLAKFLVGLDDNYSQFKLFTTTFGRADAKHIGKFSYNTTVQIINTSDGKDHIDWIPWNEFNDIEFNNFNEYLKASCNEFFNMEEWYQPTKILLDFGAISHNDTSKGWQKKYFNLTENKNIKLPFLCVGLSRGLSQRNDIYLDYKEKINSNDFTIVMINDITHLDGDTITDNQGKPIIADVIYNWLNNKKIFLNNN